MTLERKPDNLISSVVYELQCFGMQLYYNLQCCIYYMKYQVSLI